jgi:YHS domain-containing protein
MNPLRLAILAILIYVGYRLIVGSFRKKKKTRAAKSAAGEATPVSDILVEDPVCRILVPKGQAIHLQHNGKMVYFCSEECCNTFVEKRGEG